MIPERPPTTDAGAPAAPRRSSAAKRSAIYAIGGGLQLGVGFALLPFVTRLLGGQDYGYLATALSVVQLAAAAIALGLPLAAQRVRLASGPSTGREVVGAAALVSLAAGLLALGVARVAVTDSSIWNEMLPVALGLATLHAVSTIGQSVLAAEGRAGSHLVVSLLRSAGVPIAGLLAAAATTGDATSYLAGGIAATAVAAVVALRPWRSFGTSRAGWQELRAELPLAVPLVPHGLALLMVASADRVVIERALDAAEAGRYHVAYVTGALVIVAVIAFNAEWAPRLLACPPARLGTEFAASVGGVLGAAGPMAVGLAFVGPLVVPLVHPAAGADEFAPIVALTAASTLPFVVYSGATHMVAALGRTGALALISPTIAAANLVSTIVAVRAFGSIGASFTTMAAYWALAIAVCRLAGQGSRSQISAWSPTVLVSTTLCGLGALVPVDGVWVGIRGVAGASAAAVLALAARRLVVVLASPA